MDDGFHSIDELVTIAHSCCIDDEPDLIFVSCNPLSSAVAASRLKSLTGLPLVIEFRDPWLNNPTRVWQTKFHYFLERRLERSVYNSADQLIFNTGLAARMALYRYPEYSADRVTSIPHFWSRRRFRLSKYNDDASSKEILVIGVGGGAYSTAWQNTAIQEKALRWLKFRPSGLPRIDPQRSSLKPLFDSLARIFDDRPEFKDRVQILFLRSLLAEDAAYADKLEIGDNIRELGGVSADQVPGILRSCHCLYLNNVVLSENKESPFVASRTFDYIASRKPIIAHLPPGQGRDLVENSGLGKIADPWDANSLYRLLLQITEEHFQGGISCAPNEDYIEAQEGEYKAAELIDIFRKVVWERESAGESNRGV